MSLSIRINGQAADLLRSTSVGLELTNPYLTYETLFTQKASWPGVPMSARNQRIFGFADNLQITGPDRYEVELLHNGQLLQQGVGVLGELAGSGFQLSVDEPLGEFFGIFDGVPLSDIAFGTIPLPAVVSSNPVQVNGENAICFPTLLNPDAYANGGAAPTGWTGKINEYTGSGYVAGTPLVPAVFVKFLLKQIAAKTGTTLSGTLLDHPQLSQLILYTNRPLPAGATDVTLRYHLPAWSIGDLLLQLRKLPNLAFDFKATDKRMTMFLTDSIFRQSAQDDWSGKAVKQVKKRPELNRRLQLAFDLDGNDQLLKDKPDAVADYLTPGEGGIARLSSKLAPLLVDVATGLPSMRIAFSQPAQPRLAFWNGMQNGVPLASPTLGGLSLNWNGAGGLRDTFWAATEAFRSRMFYAERDMLLTETDLAGLNFGRKKHINGVDYVVARIVVSLPVRKAAQCLLIRA